MGRKAKLKKIRKTNPSQESTKSDPTQFVKELQRQGYELKQIERGPEIPETKIEPQI
jgi:hypothetical protein